MLVTQAELDSVLNPKIRRRVLYLPLHFGQFGELKRCPAKEGGVYRLRAQVPLRRFRAMAATQPTVARSVLRFVDLCQQPTKAVTITVLAVTRAEHDGKQVWAVFFERGDHGASFDRPVFLAKQGDYTTVASRQAVPGDPEVLMPFAADLEKARAKAREQRISPRNQIVSRMQADADTLAKHLKAMKDRNRLKLIAKELEKLAKQTSVDGCGTLAMSVCAESQAAVECKDSSRPSGTKSDVSLEPAA